MVQVVSGVADVGKKGKVLAVLKERQRIVVDGVNVRPSFIPPEDPSQRGKFVDKPWSLHYSNVQLLCPETDQPTKVGYRRTESGRRERYAKVSGAAIPLPEEHLDRGPKDYRVGPLDTEQGDVERETFQGFDDFGREVGIKDWGAVHFVSAKHEEKGRS